MKWYHKLGISFINILILGAALIFIYLNAVPVEEWGFVTVDAGMILLIVIILYMLVNVFVALCLTYMQEHNAIAKIAKSLIMTIVIIALFDYALFPILWIFGYDFMGEGDFVRNTLILASLIRLVVRVWLGRRFGGDAEE